MVHRPTKVRVLSCRVSAENVTSLFDCEHRDCSMCTGWRGSADIRNPVHNRGADWHLGIAPAASHNASAMTSLSPLVHDLSGCLLRGKTKPPIPASILMSGVEWSAPDRR